MIANPFEWIVGSLGLLAGAVASGGAVLKFLAWWKDRNRQTRIDSATYFAEKGGEPWHRAFGEQQRVRMQFAVMTGIDRDSGHEALLRYYERVGGIVGWSTLAGLGRFLVVTGPVARVRKLTARDHRRAVLALVLCIVAGLVALAAGMVPVVLIAKANGGPLGFMDLFTAITASVYALGFLVATWMASDECGRYVNTFFLRRKLKPLWAARRKNRFHATRSTALAK